VIKNKTERSAVLLVIYPDEQMFNFGLSLGALPFFILPQD
jgi:hypothetical protein